jgi:antitoxin VapB
MPQTYTSRQLQGGNSQVVRLPANIAFPPKPELVLTREGEKIIVHPLEETMENVPQLFAALKQHVIGAKLTRPEFATAVSEPKKQL